MKYLEESSMGVTWQDNLLKWETVDFIAAYIRPSYPSAIVFKLSSRHSKEN